MRRDAHADVGLIGLRAEMFCDAPPVRQKDRICESASLRRPRMSQYASTVKFALLCPPPMLRDAQQ